MIIINCKNRKIESCLKEYRQKSDRLGIVKELRGRKTFEKPSVKKRQAKLLSKYRNEKYGDREL